MSPTRMYHKGRVAPRNLEFLKLLSHSRHRRALQALPRATEASWDSRTLGIVPPVKDQGQCGSCWDFSGTRVCEIAFWMAGLQIILSEEYTLSCGQNGGCNGDDNTNVLDWAKKTGIPLTSDYGPYQAAPGQCRAASGMKLYKIDDWGFADPSGQGGYDVVTGTQDIKNAIKAYGCVGCAIAADDAFSNNPADKVFDHNTSSQIDHDVVLVGWDDSKGKAGAWILNNSWGTSWCDKGYIWIGYGVNQVGTEAVFARVNSQVPPQPWVI